MPISSLADYTSLHGHHIVGSPYLKIRDINKHWRLSCPFWGCMEDDPHNDPRR
ncbi:hypothetical protein DL93DRAFT_2092386 [Clavulina sp. PMI_390]|nr:hypothetical protein DL93DRAFT_2092386 [Clavulina sp. PMI_390]